MKKRKVILFGAGAVLDWKAPSTQELTKLIRKSGYKCRDNETYVTEYIYQKLIKNGFLKNEINFETIINVIDELIIYYSNFDFEHKTPSILKCFLAPRFTKFILNFTKNKADNNANYDFTITIPEALEESAPAYFNETPKQYYFEHLLVELLSVINEKVSNYSCHTRGNDNVIFSDEKEKLSQNFQQWIKSKSEKSILRMYTLNYDRQFKILSERINLNIFEGFDCDEYIENKEIGPKIKKILTDLDSNIHYNLHGCSNWMVKTTDLGLLEKYDIVLKPTIDLMHNDYKIVHVQMEKGKSIVVSNIITGFQKAQKSFLSPFRQMQSAFDKDCILADEIIVIGYSFGDAHINESIRTAIKYNKELKLHFIDPTFDLINGQESAKLNLIITNIFPEIIVFGQNSDTTGFKEYYYFDKKLRISAVVFGEFLENQNNKTKIPPI